MFGETKVRCDQYNCEHHVTGGFCRAEQVTLVEAPGGFWLSCRMKTNGKRWKPEKEQHVCGKQGFGVGPEGLFDICQACEDEKKEEGF